jgi:hypothetical protein
MKRKIHWHIFLTHFPISLFGVSAGFQILHLFMLPDCFEVATNVCVLGATLMLAPTAFTGWTTWKKTYQGFRSPIFVRKIRIAWAMLAVSIPLTVFRFAFLDLFTNAPWNVWHWVYLASTSLLIGGAVFEGYFGSSLHHK